MKKFTKKSILICVLLHFVFVHNAQEISDSLKAKDLIHLSFEELMQVQINTGTLTSIERSKVPATVTIITREDIENTPARNLLDLIEVYVPDGSFTNHWLGSRIGIRGISGDQNNSFLLVVNGETMNLQCEDGPITEIQSRDLSDIDKIEIISGPGSVTYGPGAIGGVISITTKDTETSDKLKLGVEHDFTYRYSTLNGNFAIKKKKFAVSLFGSIGSSQGIQNPEFYYIDRAHGYGYGYMSEDWGNKGKGTPAPNFYADFDDRPEIKAQLNIKFLNEFKFWARYSNHNFVKQQQKSYSQEGPAFPGYYAQQFTSNLTNKHTFSDKLQLQSTASYQSISLGDNQLYQGANKPFNDITQKNNSYSENNISLRSLLSYTPSAKLKIALGAEYKYWFYRPEWGKSNNTFILDFAPPIKFAVIDPSSGFYEQYNDYGIVTELETPINAHQFSGFYELNYMPGENTTLLFSGRLDQHNLAQLAFSPRIAIIQEINNTNFIKLIAQQSVRLPNFRELYPMDFASEPSPIPETLRGIELIYTSTISQNFSVNLSAFYNSIEQIAWTDQSQSEFFGTFNTAGFTADLTYEWDDLNIGLSYSYINQLNWKPEYEFDAYLTNIGIDSMNIPLVGAGENRINNMPQHQLKLVTSYKINEAFYIHFNSRFAAKYGQSNMLNLFKSVHDDYGSIQTKQEMNNIYDDVISKGYSEPSFTSNLSATYKFQIMNVNMAFTGWVMNLVAINHVRYVYQYWEEGNNRQYPRQVGFIEEPRSFGMRLAATF